MRRSRRIQVVLALILVTGGLVAYIVAQTLWKKEPVRVGYLDFTASIPYYVADDLNLFHRILSGVSAREYPTANSLANDVSLGNVDVAVEFATMVGLQVWEISPNSFCVFTVDYATPEQHMDNLLVLDESPIYSVEDLRGKKVAVFPGSTSQVLLDLYLRRHGMSLSEMHTVPLAPQLQAAALEQGDVDAVYAYEPLSAVLSRSGSCRVIVDGVTVETMNPMPVGIGVMSRQFVDRRPGDAQAVRDVFYEAIDYIRTNSYDARTILQQRLELRIDYAWETTWLDTRKTDEADRDIMQEYIGLLYEHGLLSTRMRAEDLFCDEPNDQ